MSVRLRPLFLKQLHGMFGIYYDTEGAPVLGSSRFYQAVPYAGAGGSLERPNHGSSST